MINVVIFASNPQKNTMKYFLLSAALAINLMCQSQIVATSTLICDGQSTTLSYLSGNQLNTTLSGGNNHRGNMFDLVAINTLTITSFDAHPMGNTTMEIYYKVGTHVGFENAAGSWILIGTSPVVAQPFGILTPVPIPINITIPAGQTYAFYVTSSNLAVSLNYSNGSSPGAVYSSDANLQFLEGKGIEYPFSGGAFSPRIWNGRINYAIPALATYTWSTGANTPSITVSPSVTTTYTVAVNTPTNVSSISISVNPTPIVAVNSGTICSGDNFTITPSGASTYTITGGLSIISPTINTTYDVIGTSSLGCVSSNTAVSSVTVNALPTITVNSGTLCIGSTFTIMPSGASTYTYSSGSSVVSPTINSTYEVTGTSSLGCVSSNTAISSVTINTVIPTITVNSGAICNGSTFTITPSGASTYTYSGGSSVVSPTTNATYNVTGTSSLGCVSSNTAVSTVTVNALPTIGAATTLSLICVGETVNLNATGATTYTWLPAGSGATVSVSPIVTTNYTVTGTDVNGCSSSTTVSQAVSLCTGVAYSTLNSEVKLYPNPSNGLFILELNSSANVVITNALGQIFVTEKVEGGSHNFNLQNQSKGLYFVKISQDNYSTTIKIIVE